jgi:hypothetical protein
MDKKMIEEATTSLEVALAHWSTDGPGELVDFRLRVAQVEALINIAQSLAVLALTQLKKEREEGKISDECPF